MATCYSRNKKTNTESSVIFKSCKGPWDQKFENHYSIATQWNKILGRVEWPYFPRVQRGHRESLIPDNLGLLQDLEHKNVLHNYIQIKELVNPWALCSLLLKHNMIYRAPTQCQTLWGQSMLSSLFHTTMLQGRSRRPQELGWVTQLVGSRARCWVYISLTSNPCPFLCGFGWTYPMSNRQ